MLRDLRSNILTLWGNRDGARLVNEYKAGFIGRDLLLRDLAAFCGANEPHPIDPNEANRIEGRRQVFLHIASMIELDPNDFIKIAEGISYE